MRARLRPSSPALPQTKRLTVYYTLIFFIGQPPFLSQGGTNMIYLDHAATTPVPREVADAMYAVLTEQLFTT